MGPWQGSRPRMFARWLEDIRLTRRARAADELEAWLTGVDTILKSCSASLKEENIPADIGVTLDRLDRELLRYRNHASAAQGALRRSAPELAPRLDMATENTYRLRNRTCAYLLRWQAFRRCPPDSSRLVNARREMEKARLDTSRAARELTGALDALTPQLQALIRTWRNLP